MSNRKAEIDARQLSIFSYLKPAEAPSPGSMNISVMLRHAASDAIRRSGKDRIDICAEMYKLTGLEVSKSSLDSWTAESRDRHSDHLDYNGNKRWGMPSEIVPAFCQVTGDWEMLFILAEAGHYKALKGKDVVRARIGLIREKIEKDKQELKQLEKALLKN